LSGERVERRLAAILVEAVACAVAVQRGMVDRNVSTPEDQRIVFRVGVNLGDIIVDGDDIHGDGVNVAARLEGIAEPGGICASRVVRDQVRDKLDLVFDDMGEQTLKNIARPLRVYGVRLATAETTPASLAVETSPTLALPDKPSIAVLPFQNMSGDPEQEYFADGIAEDVITLLSKSRTLFVIARNSTFTYKGKAVDVKQVGRELGVRYVLEGSVRKAANRVRVTTQLIEAATGGHLWAERYDRDLTDIFVVQDEITASVSAAILPTMERSERERAARKPPDSLDAWECYHRGMWHFFKLNPADNEQARMLFERSLRLDSGSSAALAGTALTFTFDAWQFRPLEKRSETVSRAADDARKCLAIDPLDSTGHYALSISLVMLGLHQEAMIEADLAVSCNPNHAWGYGAIGATRAFGGRPSEAIEPLSVASRLSPFDPLRFLWLHWTSRALYWAGNYEAAISVGQGLLRSHPELHTASRTLIAALGQVGRLAEAKQVMTEALQRFGDEFFRAQLVLQTGEMRIEDHEHMIAGYRKAGVLE
jgi:adenylate cyclase